MRYLVILLVLALASALGAAAYALQRLGGWRYTLYRMEHSEAGLYRHRVDLFERLPDRPGAIVFLGDSHIEQGEWSELTGLTGVINRGITADHTQGLAARLNEIIRHQPRAVVLMIGVNDLLFGRSVEATAHNYRSIVERIRREASQAELILMSVPPVNAQIKRIRLDNAIIRQLNTAIENIAREYTLHYVDLHTLCADADMRLSSRLTDDGIHLNGQGYVLWKTSLQRLLE